MSRRHRAIRLRTFLVASVISLLLVSVGYALFSQNLSLHGKGTAVVTQQTGLHAAWSRSMWQSGSNWSYNMNGTVTNAGATTTSGWEIVVQLPATITGVSCWSADCSLNGLTLTISNLSYNGTLAPNASTNFGVSFTSSSDSIVFTNYTISTGEGSESDYTVISGLTATMSLQNQWQSGSNYVKQYNVTVQNSSGTKVKAWRIEITNWNSTTHSVAGIWNTGYVSEPSRLLLTSQGGLNSGASASFGTQLSVPSSSWSPSYVVKGRL